VSEKMIQPVDLAVGNKIRLRRKMAGLSQTALADKLGVTFQQVQKYEKGANRVSASRLQMIASVLRMPVSEFFEGSVSGSDAASDIEAFYSTTEGIKLTRALLKITDADVRKSLVGLAEAIASETER
jgi:transcriptional regulator with XRE-family HTH domain